MSHTAFEKPIPLFLGEAMIKLTGYFNQILRDEPDNSPPTADDNEPAADRSVTISRLLNEAYEFYPHVTREANEKMRLHHRLQVGGTGSAPQKELVIRSKLCGSQLCKLLFYSLGCAKH